MAWPAHAASAGAGGAVNILQRRRHGHHHQQSVGLLTALALSTGFLLFSNVLTTTFRNLKRARRSRRRRPTVAPMPHQYCKTPTRSLMLFSDAAAISANRSRALHGAEIKLMDVSNNKNYGHEIPFVSDASGFASAHAISLEEKAGHSYMEKPVPTDPMHRISSMTSVRSQAEYLKATKSRSLCSDEVADHASREEYLAEALTRRGKRDAVAAKYKHDSSEPCFLARKYLSKAQSMNVHRPGALGAVTTLHVLSLHNDDQRAAAKTYEGRFNIVSSRRRNRAEARDRPQYVQHHEQESSCNRRQHRLYDIRVARNSASSPLHLHPGEIKVTRTTKKVRFSCSDVDHPELQDVNGGGAARTLKDADKKMSPFSSRLAGRRCAGQTETTTIKKGQGPTEEIVQTNTSSTSNNAPSSSTLKSSATSHATKRPDATAPEPLKPSWQKT